MRCFLADNNAGVLTTTMMENEMKLQITQKAQGYLRRALGGFVAATMLASGVSVAAGQPTVNLLSLLPI